MTNKHTENVGDRHHKQSRFEDGQLRQKKERKILTTVSTNPGLLCIPYLWLHW